MFYVNSQFTHGIIDKRSSIYMLSMVCLHSSRSQWYLTLGIL